MKKTTSFSYDFTNVPMIVPRGWQSTIPKKIICQRSEGIIGNPERLYIKIWREKEPLPTKSPKFWRQNPQVLHSVSAARENPGSPVFFFFIH